MKIIHSMTPSLLKTFLIFSKMP